MAGSKRRHGRVSLHAAAAAVISIVAGLGLAAQAHAQSPPACTANTVVQTRSGPVCGFTANGQTSYLNIPYAAPPVGRLRWRPPQPAQTWTSALSATQRGAACPTPGFAGAPPQAGTSEDCLTLEVQRPANVPAGRRLPVMFEIHGGGFIGEALTDNGTNFVSSGPVVYVYVKYRLGILGSWPRRRSAPTPATTASKTSRPRSAGSSATSPASAATRTG
jgi:para-nitrobenzyl esterase